MVIKLKEMRYEDTFGKEFLKLKKKYSKRKKDYNLYVNFSNRDMGNLSSSGWASPDHNDPKGIYGYPLWYVLDYPSDIWYGKNVKYAKVIEEQYPRKTLFLQGINRSEGESLLMQAKYKHKLPVQYDLFDKVSRQYSGVSKYGKTFFDLIQKDYKEFPDNYTIRSAEEQTNIFLKLGYWAIRDTASRASQAVINSREPVQICFFHAQSYRVLETFELPDWKQSVSYRGTNKITNEPSSGLIRKMVQNIFSEIFNDSIEKNQKDMLVTKRGAEKNVFFSKGGRKIKVGVRSTQDRSNLSFGEKPHRAYRKADQWQVMFFIESEYGEHTFILDDETFDQLLTDIRSELMKSEKISDWKPLTKQDYLDRTEAEYRKDVEEKLKEEQREKIERFPEVYKEWVDLANKVGVSIPSINFDDKKKVDFYDLDQAIQNIYNRSKYTIDASEWEQAGIIDKLIDPQTMEHLSMVHLHFNELWHNFFKPILLPLEPYITNRILLTTYFLSRAWDERETESN